LSKISGKDVAEVLTDLKRAGLNALPGGGAETFSDRLREELYPAKIDHRRWLEIAKTAHKLGLKSNATLLFGHLETEEEIIEHLIMLRAAQDETGGFECFVPLPFLPENTKLSHLPPVSAQKILRTFAISRLVLDNFPHLKSYWVFLGVGLGQVALLFGADHFHGTVIEEKISESHKSEVITNLPQDEIEKLIKEVGGTPVLI
jgi:aminodeoxyfutalosine synthase